MSKEKMRAYCADRLLTGMATSWAGVGFKPENQRFQPNGAPYVEMLIDETHSGAASTGARQRFYRTHELLSFVLNWPENTGTKEIGEFAEFVKDLFQGSNAALDTAYVTFHVGKTVTQGLSNGYYRMVVMIPCWRDQSKPPAS